MATSRGTAQVGPYVLGPRLGEGGMGEVVRAVHQPSGRAVAVKFIGARLADDPLLLKRFAAEATIGLRLRHEHVVAVLDIHLEGPEPYVVFELVEGPSLRAVLDASPARPRERGLAIVADAARGLGYAHRQGVVHRDVKPENILTTADGRGRLADFGLAKMGELTQVKTQTGVVFGTPAYIAPEQARGEPCTAASDLYSLGAVVFEVVAGQPPFGRQGGLEVVVRHLKEQAPSLAALVPETPPALADLVARCLAKQPADRPAGAEAVAEVLEAAAAGGGLRRASARPRTAPREGRTGPSQRGSRRPLALALGLAVAVAAGALGVFHGRPPAPARLSDLSVLACGATSVALLWRGPNAAAPTALFTAADGRELRMPVRVLHARPEGDADSRVCVGVAAGLAPRSDLRVALEEADGTRTLSRRCTTGAPGDFAAHVVPALSESGELLLRLSAARAFSVTAAASLQYDGPGFVEAATLRVPLAGLPPETALRVTMHDVDGDRLEWSRGPRELLTERVESLWNEFTRERRGGRSPLCAEVREYLRRSLAGATPQEAIWKGLRALVLSKVPSWAVLDELGAGLPALLRSPLADARLRRAVTLAAAALQTLVGGAMRQGLQRPAPPAWEAWLADEARPAPRVPLPPPSGSPTCRWVEWTVPGPYRPPLLVHDPGDVSFGLWPADLVATVCRYRVAFDVDEVELGEVERAVLVYETRTCLLDVVPIVDFAGTALAVAFWDPDVVASAACDAAEHDRGLFTAREFLTLRTREQVGPWLARWSAATRTPARSIAVEVPVSALRAGSNEAELRVLTAQCSAVDYAFCAGFRLVLFPRR